MSQTQIDDRERASATDGVSESIQEGEVKIRLQRVSKFFGEKQAVQNISFSVAVGEVLGVMGPNGAGKTTTMRMIAGFLRPSAGKITLDGLDIGDRALAAKKSLGYLPEGAPLWQSMTPFHFLQFAARVRGFSTKESRVVVGRAMELADLTEVALQPIATLSKGFRRRVGLAQAILHDPPVLVLDEPTDGLDPNQKRHVRELIRSMAETKAIIISTHILEEVEPLCTRVLIMNKGKTLADETPAQFAARSEYYNAVSVRVARRGYKKLLEVCTARKNEIKNWEVVVKMNEAHITFFPQDGQGGETIAQNIRIQATKLKLPLRSLTVEGGRLEDVFYQMTRSENGMSARAIAGAAE